MFKEIGGFDLKWSVGCVGEQSVMDTPLALMALERGEVSPLSGQNSIRRVFTGGLLDLFIIKNEIKSRCTLPK
jgi:hypothetical protein